MSEAVLIAGAGPVGLSAACALKRLGVDVRIVDKATAPSQHSKALVVWPRTLELLDIEGCASPFVEAGLKGTGTRIYANGREVVHVPLDAAKSDYPFALLIPQNETERLLGAHLRTLGVEVERGVTLQSFHPDDGMVSARLLHPDGRQEELHVAALLGCDGAHSVVRHGLDVPFAGTTEPSDFLLADLHLHGGHPGLEISVHWVPEGILAIFPIVGDRFRVIADTPPAETSEPPTLAEIQAKIDERGPGGLEARDPVWLSRFRINERKVKDYGRGRIFLLGDAAHIHSPAGGQGMNTGMQDAFNLAWKLALVLKRKAGEALLDTYSPERSAIGDLVLSNASRLTHVAMLHNPILQEIRNLAAGAFGRIPALRQRIVDQMSELDLHYADSPLTGTGGSHPAAGHRARDVAVKTEGRSGRLDGVLRSGRFVLLSVETAAPAIPDELADLCVGAEADADPAYAGGRHYLVRPDAYVAASAEAGHPDALFEHLRRFAAR